MEKQGVLMFTLIITFSVCPLLCIKIRIDFLLIPRALKAGRKAITPFRPYVCISISFVTL